MNSKYIIIHRNGMDVPLVFSPLLLHADVAGQNKVRSAGYCQLDAAGKWMVGGGSVSLHMEARPQDAEILNQYMCC